MQNVGGRVSRQVACSIAGLTIVVGLVGWLPIYWGKVWLATDSTTYLYWGWLVPLGYPLFLRAVDLLTGSLAWVGAAQLFALAAATLYLSFAALRISPLVAAFVPFAALLVPGLFTLAGALMPESVYAAMILVNVGAGLRLLTMPSKEDAVTLALAAAIAIFFRPAGWFIVAEFVFLMLALPAHRGLLLRWLVLPFVVALLVTVGINAAVRGDGKASQAGRVLFARVAVLYHPSQSADPLAAVVGAAIEPMQAEYRAMTDPLQRHGFQLNNYNRTIATVEEAARIAQPAITFPELEALQMRLFLDTTRARTVEVALLVIEHAVLSWHTNVLANFAASRTLAEVTADPQRAVGQIMTNRLPVDPADLITSPAIGPVVSFFDNAADGLTKHETRWLAWSLGAVLLLAIPTAILFPQSQHLMALALCGTIVHGAVIFASMVTVFIPRYALPTDPVLMLAGIILVTWPIDAAWRAISGLNKPPVT